MRFTCPLLPARLRLPSAHCPPIARPQPAHHQACPPTHHLGSLTLQRSLHFLTFIAPRLTITPTLLSRSPRRFGRSRSRSPRRSRSRSPRSVSRSPRAEYVR
ncbi:hypothetical protein E2C01_016184 [Portunus trituberculatus]|uniref:Uncharacterized protein n=1 Tax=Portunus trituberculatus TaxID=210409 RepID=A0A5B7DPL5_PORTR|nr:hypothetical protein [Portunus trituberculatus]